MLLLLLLLLLLNDLAVAISKTAEDDSVFADSVSAVFFLIFAAFSTSVAVDVSLAVCAIVKYADFQADAGG